MCDLCFALTFTQLMCFAGASYVDGPCEKSQQFSDCQGKTDIIIDPNKAIADKYENPDSKRTESWTPASELNDNDSVLVCTSPDKMKETASDAVSVEQPVQTRIHSTVLSTQCATANGLPQADSEVLGPSKNIAETRASEPSRPWMDSAANAAIQMIKVRKPPESAEECRLASLEERALAKTLLDVLELLCAAHACSSSTETVASMARDAIDRAKALEARAAGLASATAVQRRRARGSAALAAGTDAERVRLSLWRNRPSAFSLCSLGCDGHGGGVAGSGDSGGLRRRCDSVRGGGGAPRSPCSARPGTLPLLAQRRFGMLGVIV